MILLNFYGGHQVNQSLSIYPENLVIVCSVFKRGYCPHGLGSKQENTLRNFWKTGSS